VTFPVSGNRQRGIWWETTDSHLEVTVVPHRPRKGAELYREDDAYLVIADFDGFDVSE
jgi:hypothetical protein